MSAPRRIASAGNALLKRVRRLAQDPVAYRHLGQVWLEGEHLCAAAQARGRRAQVAVLDEPGWNDPALRALATSAAETELVPTALFAALSALESPARIGWVIELPPAPQIAPALGALVLDRVQDAGNVGSTLRSAAAFGVAQVLALRGTASLWSPKVLRAGMGAHFALRLVEGLDEAALGALALPLVGTSPHAALALHEAPLPSRCAWVVGHEGQGVAATLQARCALTVRIPQPGGEESLNVAAAAAVCLYESARRGARPPEPVA